jgi:hypothetical protein
MRSKGWVALLVVGFAALPAAADNNQDGLVLGIVGKWHDAAQKNADIHFGSKLTDQSLVTCETGGSLTVWFKEARKPVPIPCETPGDAIPIKNVRAKATQGVVASISDAGSKLWQLVTPFINLEPRSYIAAVSRGFGNAELEESVAIVRGGQVDVKSALAGAPAGKYAIAFLPTTEDIADALPVAVDWQPGRTAMVKLSGHAPGDAPGLLKIAIAAPDGTLSAEAWILLLPPDRYAAAGARFEAARAAVAPWPGGTRSQASRAVLRACLQALSQNGAPQ